MQQAQLEGFKHWFTQYVAGFYEADDDYLNRNIQLKECHTHRVCNEMRQLTKALDMDANDALIAETIALFHDTGRFPQFRQYRTYKDTKSENHCLLALKVLAENKVLNPLADDERAIIETAIRFHGERELPAMDDRTAHFSKMIRDADKIDIFDLLAENYRILAEEPEKFVWEVEFPDTPDCNPEIIDALINKELIHYDQVTTITDAKLLQLGWVYDTYFDWSLKQIHDRGYLRSLIDLLPDTPEVKQAVNVVMEYTAGRIHR